MQGATELPNRRIEVLTWCAVIMSVVLAAGIYLAGAVAWSHSGSGAFGSVPRPGRAVPTNSPTSPAPAGSALARPVLAGSTPPAMSTPTVAPTPAPRSPADPARPVNAAVGGGGRTLATRGPLGTVSATTTRTVALTFDDGPSPQWTPQILAVLRKARVTATFCVVGAMASAYPELVRAIVAGGHTLCNHSWNHDVRLGRRGWNVIRADLARTNAAIHAAAPKARVRYFRQPGGSWTVPVVGVARSLGMAPLHWSADPRDWARPSAGRLATFLTRYCRPGAIVLLHDGGGDRRSTRAALGRVLPTLSRAVSFRALSPRGI